MKVQVVVGGQWGSEAKGHVCGFLAREATRPACFRVGGSQAGHTVVPDDMPATVRHVPVGLLTNPRARGFIAQGSEVDLDVLRDEIDRLELDGFSVRGRLVVDREATVIGLQDLQAEAQDPRMIEIGSTKKGVGAARASRILRSAERIADAVGSGRVPCATGDTLSVLWSEIETYDTVLVEGCQGFGLGLHAGYYPTCTSTDCRTVDALAAVGLGTWGPGLEVEPWVVLRTYPIRVAGNSGPMYQEISWEELAARTGGHVKPELTTVTRKVRRVGEWDLALAKRAIWANGYNPRIALMFFDYLFPELAGSTSLQTLLAHPAALEAIFEKQRELGFPISLLGTGPGTMIDLRDVDGREGLRRDGALW